MERINESRVQLTDFEKVLCEKIQDNDIDGMTIKEFSRLSPLSSEEQLVLVEVAQDGYRAEAKQIRLNGNGTSEEKKILKEIIEEGKNARDKLETTNLRLVVSVARKYKNKGIPFPDLLQVGRQGFTSAIIKFDSSKNCEFSTYATWWIRQAIGHEVEDHARTIRVSSQFHFKLRKFARLRQELGRDPTVKEIIENLKLKEKEAILVIQTMHQVIYLSLLEEDEGRSGNRYHSETQRPTEDKALSNIIREYQKNFLFSLPFREMKAWELTEISGLSYKDTGKIMEVCGSRVWELKEQTKNRLKKMNIKIDELI